MKKLNKLLALLLALAMVFSMAACSSSDDDDDDKKSNVKETVAKEQTDAEKVVGKWQYQIDLSDVFGQSMAQSMNDAEEVMPDAPLYMNVIFDFASNGDMTLTMEIDKDSLETFKTELVEKIVDYMYKLAETQGMSKADFDTLIQDQSGKTVKKYFEDEMNNTLNATMGNVSQSITGYYELDDKEGRIYIGETKTEMESKEEYAEYSFSGEKLKLTDFVEDGKSVGALGLEAYGVTLPWTFDKQ